MIRSCIRQAVRVFAGAAFFSCALAAHAGGITLNDSNCDSFSISGPPGNQVLTCVVSNAPANCSIQGPTTGTLGTPITLTAVCASGSPNSYAWIGGSCPGQGQSCQDTQTVAQSITYKVTPSNGVGPGNQAIQPVVWSNAPPAKPSACSISVQESLPLPVGGQTVHLTAVCANGGQVDTWTWSIPGGSGNTWSANVTQTTTVSVTATNGGGSGTASLAVNVSGGGGGAISCSGFLNTNVLVMNWPNWVSNQKIPMGLLDAGVLKFTTGSTTGTGTLYETSGSGNPAAHDATLSATPCDFGPGLAQTTNTTSNRFALQIGGTPGGVPVLQPNSTYYVNFRNSAGTPCGGAGIACDVGTVNLTPPR